MPLPSQTFHTITALLNYINTAFVPNGNQEITGQIGNDILNSLGNFIVKYTLNNALVTIDSSSGGVVVISKPLTAFTGAPTSIQWADNIQNEYYIINATGFNIPITSGFSYVDQYQTVQTIIPARTAIHIAKATNGNWIQVNNLSGSGSGGNLPPQATHEGEVLFTNGTTSYWSSNHVSVTSADFINATDCPLTGLALNKFSLFWSTGLANYIYEDINQWEYLVGGGFRILIPGFDSTANFERFELSLKGLNS